MTWGFGITSLACLAAWGYLVTQRPLSPRPRVWKYLAIAWGVVALPLATWFVVWGLSGLSQSHRVEGETPRIVSWTVIGLMAPYVAMALVWLIFGPAPESSAAAEPKPPRRPTYTRWVIVPMLALFALWLVAVIVAPAQFGLEPLQIMQVQLWGLILLGLAFPCLLVLRWMQTLPSAPFWTLVQRLALSVVCLVLALVAFIVYVMSPWNNRYIESHGLVFRPSRRPTCGLSCPCEFDSSGRSQSPCYTARHISNCGLSRFTRSIRCT